MFPGEAGGHAGEVADRGDGGAEALAERFAAGAAAEVVVAAAGTGGLRDDLELAVGAAQGDDRLLQGARVGIRGYSLRRDRLDEG